MATASMAPIQSLYVHVPFCARKCAYCAFYSTASSGTAVQRYVSALIGEMERVAPELEPVTIFFGGGTPSLLTVPQWEAIFQAMDRLGLRRAQEWTVECNPATVSLDKARLWRQAGVNRVSLGVQSLDENLLDRLGRIHSRQAVFDSFDLLRRAGFENLNLDLMFAIPGQSLELWRSTLTEALALGSEHLACYEVIYEEDTPLFHLLRAGAVREDEDLACAMYETLLEEADRHGLAQYEIANFARPTSPCGAPPDPALPVPHFACRHNINYWRGGSYHGLGPSAAGFAGGRRTKNIADTQRYCEMVEQGQAPREGLDDLSPLARAGEIAAFGLRMNIGWPYAQFRQVTGFDLETHWKSDLDDLVSRNWGIREPQGFRLSPLGMRFADAAAQQFLR